MNITMTRQALTDRLRDRLEAAKVEDARRLKEHAVQEKSALLAFRQSLREAMKWDYATLKKQHNFTAGLRHSLIPRCPRSEADEIDRVLRMVELDTRKVGFRISAGSDVDRAINWLPESERPKAEMC
jgi:hypothetical protein